MELTAHIAWITVFICLTFLVIFGVIALVKESGEVGAVGAAFFVLTVVFVIVGVVQSDEEKGEDRERRHCISVADGNIEVMYNDTKYYINDSYVTLCEVPK